VADNYITFMGTAGARFVVARQLRYSAGVFLSLCGARIALDPGPGALLRYARSRPSVDVTELDALILSHGHIDHAGDVNAMLDAMTAGGFRQRGALMAPGDCLDGDDPVVLRYLRRHLDRIVALRPRAEYAVGDLRICTSPRHAHPVETYGLKFHVDGTVLAFLTDTRYFDGLAEAYADADVLVVNVARRPPVKRDHIMHLALDDARRVIGRARPRKAVLTHFGTTMLKARPRRLAAELADDLGLDVVAATDGLTLPIG